MQLTQEQAANKGYYVCLLDGSRGIYLPQDFVNNFDLTLWNVRGMSEDIRSLENGPDDEWYWESWESILDHAQMTDDNGMTWRLYQDGDLFAYATSNNGVDIEIID